MEHGVVPKESLEVDRDEKMDRDTREKIKVNYFSYIHWLRPAPPSIFYIQLCTTECTILIGIKI